MTRTHLTINTESLAGYSVMESMLCQVLDPTVGHHSKSLPRPGTTRRRQVISTGGKKVFGHGNPDKKCPLVLPYQQ